LSLAAESDFLLGMAEASRQRDAESRARLSDAQLSSQLARLDTPLPLLLAHGGFDVIAEIKKRSPAEGKLDDGLASPQQQAGVYIEGGAAALSVLTEPSRFDGSLEDLQAVVAVAGATPVMRKDFLVSRYQIREGRLAGASGVLLIAAMLEAGKLEAMLEAAFELDMFVLVEAFDMADLDSCLPVLESMGPALDGNRCRYMLGVNCRNLRTLQVEFDHFTRMAEALPSAVPCVAESGLTDVAQAQQLAKLGYRLALVGTTLMRSDNAAGVVGDIRRFGATGAAACS
jgi:indole-3-glycerol phosphate synthase